MTPAGRRIEIRGTVQGVGFRPWVVRLAGRAGVTGRVCNDAAGVLIEAFGPPAALDAFDRRLRRERPPAARIGRIESRAIPGEAVDRFEVVASRAASERRVSIPADLGTCAACEAELRDPANRRFRYAFTNCTDCGPRFTIALDVPYDRATTTMARFAMCPDCRREYDDPRDRRFHAQPNACPACGPALALLDAAGAPVAGVDPLAAAADALRCGRIVAVKGLGGYHLACDATDADAVARLRARKRRDEKPFAVMVGDVAAARALARVSRAEARALAGPERPIVLLERRARARGPVPCAGVAPRSRLLGLMLPATPLHALLCEAAARPLVMTSGNRTDEPMVHRDAELVARLGGIADLFLAHDRPIATRCDDSVVRLIGRRPTLLRRARGWVPRPIPLRRPLRRPVLACGAHLKNTFCLGVGDQAFLGPHVGDLETLEAWEAYREAIERMERFVGVVPEVIAHDAHPDYLSTRYARERAGDAAVAVQHHHAHVVSAMAEAGLAGPVVGLAWDGTGHGGDGTSWGGEALRADVRGFERVATFRPLPLAGGDRAIRQVWRLALALLRDAFDGAVPAAAAAGLLAAVPAGARAGVEQMLEHGIHCPPAHGVGRWFDAVGALVLARPVARFEGQVALEWNGVADPRERRPYPFELGRDGAGPAQVDLRPMVRALVADHVQGVPAATLAGRFHETLAAAAVAQVRAALADRSDRTPVVLSGGCFQNPLLVARIRERLRGVARVVLHREVPPGDGGLALGQAVVADALASGGG